MSKKAEEFKKLQEENKVNYFIFDMDGTILDSMKMWRDSGDLYLEMENIEKTKEFALCAHGVDYDALTLEFVKYYKLDKDLSEIKKGFERAVTPKYHNELLLKDGAFEYFKKIKDSGKKMCIATATRSELAKACMKRLGVDGFFETIVSTKDLKTSKHDPDIYNYCTELMGGTVGETAVFEDALYAATTAKKAGYVTVGVFDEVFESGYSELCEVADYAIKNYSEII